MTGLLKTSLFILVSPRIKRYFIIKQQIDIIVKKKIRLFSEKNNKNEKLINMINMILFIFITRVLD